LQTMFATQVAAVSSQIDLFQALYPVQQNQFIVGGIAVSINKYPFMVALVKRGQPVKEGHFCGGSLIPRNFVLTAAHCLYGQPFINAVDVVVGLHDLKEGSSTTRFAVAEVILHPDFNPGKSGMQNDIALLYFQNPVTSADSVRLANSGTVYDRAGVTGTVTGWGNIRGSAFGEDKGFERPDVLQEVELPIVDTSLCEQAMKKTLIAAGNGLTEESFNGVQLVTDSMFCAGVSEGGKDACKGDSGGPMFVAMQGRRTQIGVVSYGLGCAAKESYGVYTRVQSYLPWLDSEIGKKFPAN